MKWDLSACWNLIMPQKERGICVIANEDNGQYKKDLSVFSQM